MHISAGKCILHVKRPQSTQIRTDATRMQLLGTLDMQQYHIRALDVDRLQTVRLSTIGVDSAIRLRWLKSIVYFCDF